jgi:hypothetical protein
MSEDDALREIDKRCRSTDYEANGAELDKIVAEFLRTNGYIALAAAMDNVECWRA